MPPYNEHKHGVSWHAHMKVLDENARLKEVLLAQDVLLEKQKQIDHATRLKLETCQAKQKKLIKK